MSAIIPLAIEVEEYLRDRRRLGFSLAREGTQLLAFASFADARGYDGHLVEAIAVAWAQRGQPRRLTAARRLDVVRRFCRYRLQFDSRTEIPGTGLFGPSTRRLTPHIYESREIEALLSAAVRLPCTKGVRGPTYATLFGLLAATGLRLSEALSLQRGDVDLTNSLLTLKKTKFARSRVVPLHPSTTRALANYASVRDRAIPAPLQADSKQRCSFSPHVASNSTAAQSSTRLPDYESNSVGKHAATTLLPASTI
jgi:integrase